MSAGPYASRSSVQRGLLSANTLTSNVRDQRRRALGAPLADRHLSAPGPVPASGMPTRDDRCIA